MNITNSLKFGFLATILIFLLAACTPAAPTPEPAPPAPTPAPTAPTTEPAPDAVTGTIGIILPTLDEPRWIQDADRFEAAFAGTDFETVVLFSQNDPGQELTNTQNLIIQGVDVIVLTAVDSVAAAASVEAAAAAGIPVIAYDRLITGTDALSYYVTFDSIRVGETMGHFLVNNASGEGNPLYLYAGALADNNSFLFFAGAWNILQPYIANGTFTIANSSEAAALADYADLSQPQLASIIGQVTTNWMPADAVNLAQANLVAAGSENKGDVFVLAPNDGTAFAIANTFLADPEVTSLFITGQDAEIPSVQAILDGIQSMTVFKDVRDLADDAIYVATAILSGTSPQTNGYFDNGVFQVPSLLTEVHEVTIDNLQEVLIDSGFLSADLFTFPE